MTGPERAGVLRPRRVEIAFDADDAAFEDVVCALTELTSDRSRSWVAAVEGGFEVAGSSHGVPHAEVLARYDRSGTLVALTVWALRYSDLSGGWGGGIFRLFPTKEAAERARVAWECEGCSIIPMEVWPA